jgi:hypothetical protein
MSYVREGDIIVTEDNQIVAKGDRVYNYYDMWPGTIVTDPDSQGWFWVKPDGDINSPPLHRGQALLNGQRICTIAFAKARGFKDAT